MRLRAAAIDPTVGVDEQTGRPLLPRTRRQLHEGSASTGDYSAYSPASSSSSSGISSSSSSSSYSEHDNFVVNAYDGDCPSVTTLVSDCNATIDYLGINFAIIVPCIIGPVDPEVEGSCEEPYADFDTYLSSEVRFVDMSIEEVESLNVDMTYT